MSYRRAFNLPQLRLLAAAFDSASAAGAAVAAPAMPAQQLQSLKAFAAAPRGWTRTFSSSPWAPRPYPQHAEPAPAAPAPAAPAAGPPPPAVFTRLEARVAGPHRPAARRVFAVVEVGGTQFKVTPDDLIVTEKLAGVDVHDTLALGRVLVLGSAGETVIGRPYVPGATVTAAVEEQFLDGKVLIFHKRRRKHSRRTKGHRQPLTSLRILSVQGIEEAEEGGQQAQQQEQEQP
jgi:large subunit ribosomal protein L21